MEEHLQDSMNSPCGTGCSSYQEYGFLKNIDIGCFTVKTCLVFVP